ncbi:DinB family protein [Candidatus Bipolaricaulota bacterium]
MLSPEKGARLWFGGASPVGSLRDVTAETAAWRPHAGRHSVWQLALHIAYWEYAVRRILDDLPTGSFPRSPSD